MNTMLRSNTGTKQSALAPSSLTTTRGPVGGGTARIHKGVWVGGGLMALTIIALATALVVKSGGSAPETPAQLAAATPPVTTTAPTADVATVAPPAAVTTPVAPVVATPAPVTTTAPVHTVHHTTHSTSGSSTTHTSSTGNTTVASNDSVTSPAPVSTESSRPLPPPVCTSCGVVESYDSVQLAGQANGIGAVAGGVGGAVLGSKIAGRNNHTLGGIIGAVAGGLAGNAIEKHERTTTAYDVHVRMDDGSMRTVRQSAVPSLGSKVTVENGALHARSSSSSYNNGGGNGSSNGNGNGGNYSQPGYNQPAPQGNGSSSFSPSGN